MKLITPLVQTCVLCISELTESSERIKFESNYSSLCQGQMSKKDDISFRATRGDDNHFVSCMSEGLTEYGMTKSF